MKISRKNSIYSIILFMSMLLCFDTYFQQSERNSLIELSSENNFVVDCIDSDLDLNEDDQIIFSVGLLSVLKTVTVHKHLHFINLSPSPFFSIWQPPKLS